MDKDDAQLRPTQRPEWVLQKLRRALQQHVEHSLLSDGRKQTWPGVSAAIEELTGVHFPHERLRQFVYGVSKEGRLHFSRPQEVRVEAAMDWVTDNDGDDPIISRDLLEREDIDIRPPLCLADIVTIKSEARPPEGKFIGAFVADRRERDVQETITLEFAASSAQGFLQVREARVVAGESKQRQIRSTGWSIVTGEDQLLIFMREEGSTLNHRWVLVQDANLWTEGPAPSLTLLRQAYPYDTFDGPIGAALNRDLFEFQRSLP